MTASRSTNAATALPYGAWPSPVTPAMLTSGPPGVREPGTNGRDLLWVESRPKERGRNVLVLATPDGPQDVTPAPFNVRSRVHEYGGGAWAATGDTIVFSNFDDGRLYRIDGLGSEARPITPEAALRYADIQIDAAHGRIVAIREDHRDPEHEAVNTLVVLDLDGPNDDGGTVIVSGTDFVSSPRLNADGTGLAWVTWNHPHMPWDETLLWRGTLADDGTVADERTVAGGPGESVILHNWIQGGDLVFVSDRTGWWHLYRAGDSGEHQQLTQGEIDFGVPLWQFGASTWAELANGTLVVAWTHGGSWDLGTLNPETGELSQIGESFTSISDVHTHPDGTRVYARAGSALEPARLVEIDPATGSLAPVNAASQTPLEAGYVSVAEPVEWETADGSIAYGFYYAPRNRDVSGPSDENERPPLIVESHGGPTSATTGTYDLGLQFWTTRGFAVLDVNYGGSTGYGRAYRKRLDLRWGVVDIDDCVSGALALVERGLADRDRLLIRGGSAGGFTTLAALAFRDTFAAGASYYGIGDLEAMVLDTHKFESRYLDGLVGPYPEAIALYEERSPIHHVDGLKRPMILFQGMDDRVVPPNQATMMADAVRAKGLPVALLTFEGEGHGFRMAETIETTLKAELSFYGQVFGFEPDGDIPRIRIDNLAGQ